MSTLLGLFKAKIIYFCEQLYDFVSKTLLQSSGAVEFCSGLRLPNEYPGYNTKQSNGEAPVILELWAIRSTSSLPSLPGLLWPGAVAPERVLSMGQIELKIVLILN